MNLVGIHLLCGPTRVKLSVALGELYDATHFG